MNQRRLGPRAGVTLIELLITLVLLGIISGVTVLAIRRIEQPRPDDPRVIIADTIRKVLASGRPALIRILTNGGPAWSNVRPDGSVIADSLLGVDRLTGAPARAK
jgi:prepilin-type N-terminal cleavage/methylation domain-containing protein